MTLLADGGPTMDHHGTVHLKPPQAIQHGNGSGFCEGDNYMN